jgi:hypothetical protein
VNTLTVAVEAVRAQPNVSDDKRTAAEDVVDAAHEKHEAVLDELENSISPSQQDEVDRAREESDKLHPSGRPARTPDPSNGSAPTRTPQPTRTSNGGQPNRTPEASRAPGSNPSERTLTPEPTVKH